MLIEFLLMEQNHLHREDIDAKYWLEKQRQHSVDIIHSLSHDFLIFQSTQAIFHLNSI
jgi:hypothetical protein